MIVDSHNPRLLGSSQLGKKSNGDWRMALLPKRAVTSLKVFVGAILMLATLVMPAWAGRVALVVGNAEYENVPSLANPRNDAEAMAAHLTAEGAACTLQILPHGLHAFQLFHTRIPEADAALDAAVTFTRKVL